MMQATWRRIGRPALLGLSVVVGLPALAQAQLFPNRTITRERPSCATEPPFYSTVRRNYFGYYPTCWTKFPDGWGCPCPNPELPNQAYKDAAFQKQPRDPFDKPIPSSDINYDQDQPLPGMGTNPANQPLNNSEIPPVPGARGRSPFSSELNPRGNFDNPGADDATAPGRNFNPGTGNRNPVRPGTGGGAGIPGGGAGGGASGSVFPNQSAADKPSATTALLEMPNIAAPASASVLAAANSEPTPNAGAMTLAPDVALVSTENADRPGMAPMPTAPTPDASIPAETVIDPSLLAGSQPAAAPAQAPQRKGILSSLFNSSKRRR